jgi:hypothetical protein
MARNWEDGGKMLGRDGETYSAVMEKARADNFFDQVIYSSIT